VPVQREEGHAVGRGVLEHDHGAEVERGVVVGRAAHDTGERGVHGGARGNEEVDAQVHGAAPVMVVVGAVAAAVAGVVAGAVRRGEGGGGVDGAVLAVPPDADDAVRSAPRRRLRRAAGGPVEDLVRQLCERPAEHRGRRGRREVALTARAVATGS
jgi:hypothetical protein